METGLEITVVDTDPDYLGIEIRAWNDRFTGTAFVVAGFHQLSEFADLIAGFPTSVPDERGYEFGSRDPHVAGGYCSFRLHTADGAGSTVLDVSIQDDGNRFSSGFAAFSLPVEPASIDTFARDLRGVESQRTGTAALVHSA